MLRDCFNSWVSALIVFPLNTDLRSLKLLDERSVASDLDLQTLPYLS